MMEARALRLDEGGGTVRERPALVAAPQAVAVPSAYRAGRGSNPVALLASVAVVATITAGIALVGAPAPAHRSKPMTVFQMELAPPPPPPPPAPVPAAASAPVLRPVSPPPIVPVPAPVPAIATAEDPAPPVVATVSPVAPGPAAPGPVSAPPAEPQAVGPLDGGDLSAKMIAAPAPSYPDECRRRREQGIVKLRVLVGIDGRVEEVGVASSSGSSRLDKAALGAVRRWRWSPVRREGAAVMVRGFVTIPFVLRV